MAKKIVKKNASKNADIEVVDKVVRKDIASLKKNDREIKIEMLAMEGRLKDFVMNLSEEQYRGFMAVYEDTNDRIKAIMEMQTENKRILDKLENLDDTVYFNHAPRITSLETIVKS